LRLFLFYLLLVVAYFVISIVVGLIVAALVVVSGDSIGLMVNALLSGVVGAIAYTVFVAVLAAVHRQLSGPSAAAVSGTFE
jgi:ABC-type Fe3+ transport system permease subunit